MERPDLLEQAAEALTNETGLTVKLAERKVTYYVDQWDARIEIEIPEQDNGLGLFVELKARVNRAALGQLKYHMDRAHGAGILVTEYVQPRLADELKELGIQFFDAWGNTYINHLPLYIFVKGNKRDRLHDNYIPPAQRAFRPAGLKLIFTLLCNPGLEGMTVRKIANAADVALGTVTVVFRNLEEAGYLFDKGRRGRRLVKKDKLLERWIEAYPEALRPKITRGRYTALDREWWINALLPKNCYWGGEVAAAKMTGYLKPETVTVYAQYHEIIKDLLIKNKLRKDPNGEIEILETFWVKEYIKHIDVAENLHQRIGDTVHPILVYADLLGMRDTRTNETARMIYDYEITKYIGED